MTIKCKATEFQRKSYFITSTQTLLFWLENSVLLKSIQEKRHQIPKTPTTFNLSLFVCLTICFSLFLPTVAMLTLWPILFLLLCDKKWILLLIKICLLIRQQIFFNSVSNTMVRAPRFDKIYHHILFTVNVNNPVANFSFSNEIYYLCWFSAGATILREWNTKKNAFPFLLFNCRIRLDSRE